MRLVWDTDMVAALIELRSRGVPLRRCADRIGVAYGCCQEKARELGLADRRISGARIGRPPLGDRAMSAAERMQRTRDRRSAARRTSAGQYSRLLSAAPCKPL